VILNLRVTSVRKRLGLRVTFKYVAYVALIPGQNVYLALTKNLPGLKCLLNIVYISAIEAAGIVLLTAILLTLATHLLFYLYLSTYLLFIINCILLIIQ